MLSIKDKLQEKKKFIIDIKNYKIVKLIQSGGFGSVYLAENILTKEQFAAKIIITQNDTPKFKTMINREIGILIRCQHPTIVNLIGYSFQDFFEENNVTILMERANKGSLSDILSQAQKSLADSNYDNTIRQIILIGIARAMKHLHQNNIIHRDLKPGNILIDDKFHPKVTDFGLSKFSETAFSTTQSMQCGTNVYMAPEMINGKRCSGKVDVYSFGILMYEVVTESCPYPLFSQGKMTLAKLHQKIVEEDYRPVFNTYVKKSIKKLIERCWSKDPNERPTFDEIFKKLAFNIEDSIYDISENDDDDLEQNKYYLDGVDEYEILNYIDEIEYEENNSINAIEKVYQKLNQLENEVKSLNEQNSQLKYENKKLNKSVASLKTKLKALNKSFESIQNENEELKIENEEIKNSIEQYKNKCEEMNEASMLCIDEIDKLKNENNEIKEILRKNQKYYIEKAGEDGIDPNKFESQLIDVLKDEIIKEKTSIEDFNSFSLLQQHDIMIKILDKSGNNSDPYLLKIIELISFLLRFVENDPDRGLQILMHENDENQILVPSNIIEKLFKSQNHDPSLIIDTFLKFCNISIELKYPSEYFNGAIDTFTEETLYRIRKNYKMTNKKKDEELDNKLKTVNEKMKNLKHGCLSKIAVFITGIEQTDNGLNGNKYINSVRFDSCVTKIGSPYTSFMLISFSTGPFEYCASLTQIEIPNSVKFIGYKAFYYCKSLSKVVIPPSVTSIAEYAFAYCSSLSFIKIPQSVTSIGDYAFYDCAPSFKALISNSLINIGKDAFSAKAKIEKY